MDLMKMSTKEMAEKGVWLSILDVNGDTMIDEKSGEPAAFLIAGTNSKVFKVQQKATGDASRKKKNGLSTAESLQHNMKMVATCVLDWKHIEWNKEPIKCTQENVLMVLSEAEPVYNQVQAFIQDASNFLAN